MIEVIFVLALIVLIIAAVTMLVLAVALYREVSGRRDGR